MKNSRKRVNSDDNDEAWSSKAKNKKRSVKKRKTQVQRIEDSGSEKSEVNDDLAPVLVNANVNGFPTFPDELLLEVMSHYPTIPLPTANSEQFDPKAHVGRRETLSALSRTCSNLRRFFRPYIWQRIEVVSGMWFPGGSHNPSARSFNLELLRQLEIVTIRDPSLAEHVKVINVEVKNCSGDAVLQELARCMALFPNLHMVKLEVAPENSRQNSKPVWHPKSFEAFSGYSYPQVRSLIVSSSVYCLIPSCPGAQMVYTANGRYDHSNWLAREMLHSCPSLQNLELELPFKEGLGGALSFFPPSWVLKIQN